MILRLPLALILAVALLAAGRTVLAAPEIAFEPFGQYFDEKPDFAEVEHRRPLSSQQRFDITPAYLATLKQEQLDQLYARLTAGPLPDGPFAGTWFLAADQDGRFSVAEGTVGGESLLVEPDTRTLGLLAPLLWAGKLFDRSRGVAWNPVADITALAPLIEGPMLELARADVQRLFPAKFFCGQSLLDGRRESIVIDYGFNDEIDGYREMPDVLAGRSGFRIRDEMRMIRPDLYLGRAHVSRFFALNFTLSQARSDVSGVDPSTVSGGEPEDCWTGIEG